MVQFLGMAAPMQVSHLILAQKEAAEFADGTSNTGLQADLILRHDPAVE